jgi:hypothetical protein
MSKQFEILENTKTYFSSKKLNEKQLAVAQALVNTLGKCIATERELDAATTTITGKKYTPWYIFRNQALRNAERKFDLSRLSGINCTAIATPVKTHAKRESRSKRENRSKVVVTSATALPAASVAALPIHEDAAVLEALEQRMIEAPEW